VICFVAIIIGSPFGRRHGHRRLACARHAVYIAPIVAFILLMAVLIMTFVRKARVGKGR
jgi:hypothetical protein